MHNLHSTLTHRACVCYCVSVVPHYTDGIRCTYSVYYRCCASVVSSYSLAVLCTQDVYTRGSTAQQGVVRSGYPLRHQDCVHTLSQERCCCKYICRNIFANTHSVLLLCCTWYQISAAHTRVRCSCYAVLVSGVRCTHTKEYVYKHKHKN